MHRAVTITGQGTGKIHLPPCHRWQVANGTAAAVTVQLLDGSRSSGTILTVAAGTTSIVMVPPDFSAQVQITGAAGGTVYVLTVNDHDAPPARGW